MKGPWTSVCVEQVRAWLLLVAQRCGMTTYEETSKYAPACDATPPRYRRIFGNLYEVSRSEHEQGRPLPTAIVTKKDGLVGPGFHRMAWCVGKHTGVSNLAFWLEEVQRVHDYWSEPEKDAS